MLVSAVKLADDRDGDLIVRVYESRGGRARATVTVHTGDVDGIRAANLLELEGDALAVAAGEGSASVDLELRPFEVATLRVRRAAR